MKPSQRVFLKGLYWFWRGDEYESGQLSKLGCKSAFVITGNYATTAANADSFRVAANGWYLA